MLVAIALLSSMDALAKWLSTTGMTVVQLLALRSLIIIPLLVITFRCRGEQVQLKPSNSKAHVARGLVGALAPLCFFLGIGRIPLTDAVVVSFSSVFTITLLSIFFLGEKIGKHRWISIFTGFLGVLIVANPQGSGSLSGYLLVLCGSIAYAFLFISGKYLSESESVASLVLSYNLCVAVVTLICLPWFWNPLGLSQYALVAGLALLAVCGQYLLTLAFTVADASLVATYEYSAVLWAIVFDLVIWNIAPSLTTAIGAVLIILSGLYIAHRERMSINFNQA
jgi:drug/metabolite transporter (DMT)-like permease